jgi:hypothetical protein
MKKQREEAIERARDGVERIFRHHYRGPGAGRPRVPATLPVSLEQLRVGLLDICSSETVVPDRRERLSSAAPLCRELVDRLLATCAEVRARAADLPDQLRASGVRRGPMWPEIVEERLKGGELPFASSEICPVSNYGDMEVRYWGQPAEIVVFAEASLRDYQELDEVGRVANSWALQLAQIAQEHVGRRDFRPPGGTNYLPRINP